MSIVTILLSLLISATTPETATSTTGQTEVGAQQTSAEFVITEEIHP